MADSRKCFYLLSLMLVCIMFLSIRMSTMVQETHSHIERLKSQLQQEEKSIHVLEAEWAYLTRPERLKKLAAQHTDMVPATDKHLMSLSNIKRHVGAMVALVKHQPNSKAVVPLLSDRGRNNGHTNGVQQAQAPFSPSSNPESKDILPVQRGSVWDVLDPAIED